MERRRVRRSIFESTNKTLPSGFKAIHDDYCFHSDLFDILCELYTVTQDLKTIKSPKSEIISSGLRQSMRSIQYYFLSPSYFNENHEFENELFTTCRLGVLVYIGIIENELWISNLTEQFTRRLKACVQMESCFITDSMRALRLWLLFLAGSLVLDQAEKPWFVRFTAQAIAQTRLSNWCDAKKLLESFAWTEQVQDKRGHEFWDEVINLQNGQHI
jgi:hypothetical protein